MDSRLTWRNAEQRGVPPSPVVRLRPQPGQVAAVSHGCPSALFKGVNILNTTQEAGR